MGKFSKIWDTQVKPLAEACITEPEFIRLMSQNEDYEPSKAEKEYLQSISEKYKDIYGMYCISEMIWKVEHALSHGSISLAELAVIQVYEVLNSKSYFQSVFLGDENNEEWQKRAALRNEIKFMFL